MNGWAWDFEVRVERKITDGPGDFCNEGKANGLE